MPFLYRESLDRIMRPLSNELFENVEELICKRLIHALKIAKNQ